MNASIVESAKKGRSEKGKREKSAETSYLSFEYFRQRRERESSNVSFRASSRESLAEKRAQGFDRAETSFLAVVTLPRDS